MASVEFLILFSSVYVAALIAFGDGADSVEFLGPMTLTAVVVSIISMISLMAMGLYQFHQRLYFSEAIARVFVALILASLVLALVFYLIPPLAISRDDAFVSIAYALSLILVVRYVFVHTVDFHIFRRAILVYGAGERAESIASIRRRADRRGFKVVARLAAPGDKSISDDFLIESDNRSISEVALDCGAEEIVVAMDDRRGNLPIRELLDARLSGIDVIDLLEFLERETGKIRIDLVRPGWLIFSPGFRRSRLQRALKRTLDVVVSGAFLLLGWPVMLLVALAIKLDDGLSAPVFYQQTRVGQGGVPFNVLKFRSMRLDAESDGKAVWASQNDSRVTRIGNFLRNTRLDELPQVLNVLAGSMSIVGPRPERPEFVEELQERIPYYSERHVIKPGLTGWAQLKYSYGASEEDAVEKLQFDLCYIKNQTLMLDVIIILQTVEVVLWGKGAR